MKEGVVLEFENLKLKSNTVIPTIYKIKADKNPIYIWGCGALGKDVLKVCIDNKIDVSGFVVNDLKFIPEGAKILDKSIILFEDLKNEEYSIIVGHSEYAFANMYLQDKNVINVYYFSGISYGNYLPLRWSFIEDNMRRIQYVYCSLSDKKSKKILESYFYSRVLDDSKYMFSCYEKGMTYFENDIFMLDDNMMYLDIGAYDGRMVQKFHRLTNGKYSNIIVLEPDEVAYNDVLKRLESINDGRIRIIKVAAWKNDEPISFIPNAGTECGGIGQTNNNTITVLGRKIDTIIKECSSEKHLDIMKINFAQSVLDILSGSIETIIRDKPKIIIRAGFFADVLIDTLEYLRNLDVKYELYLRYTVGMPQGITIFAI